MIIILKKVKVSLMYHYGQGQGLCNLKVKGHASKIRVIVDESEKGFFLLFLLTEGYTKLYKDVDQLPTKVRVIDP